MPARPFVQEAGQTSPSFLFAQLGKEPYCTLGGLGHGLDPVVCMQQGQGMHTSETSGCTLTKLFLQGRQTTCHQDSQGVPYSDCSAVI